MKESFSQSYTTTPDIIKHLNERQCGGVQLRFWYCTLHPGDAGTRNSSWTSSVCGEEPDCGCSSRPAVGGTGAKRGGR